ncbi:uncharacterized protein SCHCODRAFT_02552351 [Schizophyllum commune H4-8]|uniref:Uncharacterized protein n=1 Tax=Schizophyllum commune (strain H4-8 / FGSC 9210) TaxID=578458 RepID=D8QF05_SCHCM|nr:uncharacterized protein SCHCODRAFT_02552351 [Schizophyllum commune H4-8]KAI5887432.1 hypothetical protein SCHCODRAFT_02552351 [Schizophyllum commune H4-8]
MDPPSLDAVLASIQAVGAVIQTFFRVLYHVQYSFADALGFVFPPEPTEFDQVADYFVPFLRYARTLYDALPSDATLIDFNTVPELLTILWPVVAAMLVAASFTFFGPNRFTLHTSTVYFLVIASIPIVRNYNMSGIYCVMISDAISPRYDDLISPWALAKPGWDILVPLVQLWNIPVHIAHNHDFILYYIRELWYRGYTWEKDLAHFAVRFLLLATGVQVGLVLNTITVWVYWTLRTILAAVCLPLKAAVGLLDRVKPDLRKQVVRSLEALVVSRQDIKAYLLETLGITPPDDDAGFHERARALASATREEILARKRILPDAPALTTELDNAADQSSSASSDDDDSEPVVEDEAVVEDAPVAVNEDETVDVVEDAPVDVVEDAPVSVELEPASVNVEHEVASANEAADLETDVSPSPPSPSSPPTTLLLPRAAEDSGSDSDAEDGHSEQHEKSEHSVSEDEHSVSEDEHSDQSEHSSTTLNQPTSAIEDKEDEFDEDMDEVPVGDEGEDAVEDVHALDAEPVNAPDAQPINVVDVVPDGPFNTEPTDSFYAEYINGFDVEPANTSDVVDTASSTEDSAPSAEYTVPSAEHITPPAEYIVSNADYNNAAFDMADFPEPVAQDLSGSAVQDDNQAAVPDALLEIPSIFDLLSAPSPDEASTPSASELGTDAPSETYITSNDAYYEAFTPNTVPEPSQDVLYSAQPDFPDMSDEDKLALMQLAQQNAMYFNTLYQSSVPSPAYIADAPEIFDASTAPLLEATDDDTHSSAYSHPDEYTLPTAPYPDFASEVVSRDPTDGAIIYSTQAGEAPVAADHASDAPSEAPLPEATEDNSLANTSFESFIAVTGVADISTAFTFEDANVARRWADVENEVLSALDQDVEEDLQAFLEKITLEHFRQGFLHAVASKLDKGLAYRMDALQPSRWSGMLILEWTDGEWLGRQYAQVYERARDQSMVRELKAEGVIQALAYRIIFGIYNLAYPDDYKIAKTWSEYLSAVAEAPNAPQSDILAVVADAPFTQADLERCQKIHRKEKVDDAAFECAVVYSVAHHLVSPADFLLDECPRSLDPHVWKMVHAYVYSLVADDVLSATFSEVPSEVVEILEGRDVTLSLTDDAAPMEFDTSLDDSADSISALDTFVDEPQIDVAFLDPISPYLMSDPRLAPLLERLAEFLCKTSDEYKAGFCDGFVDRISLENDTTNMFAALCVPVPDADARSKDYIHGYQLGSPIAIVVRGSLTVSCDDLSFAVEDWIFIVGFWIITELRQRPGGDAMDLISGEVLKEEVGDKTRHELRRHSAFLRIASGALRYLPGKRRVYRTALVGQSAGDVAADLSAIELGVLNALRRFGDDELLNDSASDQLIYHITQKLLTEWMVPIEAQILMESLDEEEEVQQLAAQAAAKRVQSKGSTPPPPTSMPANPDPEPATRPTTSGLTLPSSSRTTAPPTPASPSSSRSLSPSSSRSPSPAPSEPSPSTPTPQTPPPLPSSVPSSPVRAPSSPVVPTSSLIEPVSPESSAPAPFASPDDEPSAPSQQEPFTPVAEAPSTPAAEVSMSSTTAHEPSTSTSPEPTASTIPDAPPTPVVLRPSIRDYDRDHNGVAQMLAAARTNADCLDKLVKHDPIGILGLADGIHASNTLGYKDQSGKPSAYPPVPAGIADRNLYLDAWDVGFRMEYWRLFSVTTGFSKPWLCSTFMDVLIAGIGHRLRMDERDLPIIENNLDAPSMDMKDKPFRTFRNQDELYYFYEDLIQSPGVLAPRGDDAVYSGQPNLHAVRWAVQDGLLVLRGNAFGQVADYDPVPSRLYEQVLDEVMRQEELFPYKKTSSRNNQTSGGGRPRGGGSSNRGNGGGQRGRGRGRGR